MKKILKLFSIIALLSLMLTACEIEGTNVDAIGGYDGKAEFVAYTDSELTEIHSGKCVVGTTYYVAIEVGLKRSQV